MHVLLWLLAAAPVWVDPGVSHVDAARVAAVAFRTPQEAWLSDTRGQIFRSKDGGRGWVRLPAVERALLGQDVAPRGISVTHTSRLVWLSRTEGLAFVYGQEHVHRTKDGGATWTKAPAGTKGYVYAVETVGEHVWICDSSGRLRHSPDRGEHWEEGPQLFDEAGVNPTNWCASLSFVDPQRGWALGWNSLWSTSDGGAHWTARTAPTANHRLTHVVLVTADVAWATDVDGTRYVTRDGAATWQIAPQPHDATPTLARRSNGRLVLVEHAEADPAKWRVLPSKEEDLLDSRPAFSVELLERLVAIRTQPLLTPATGKRVALAHVAQSPAGTWGASDQQVFHAEPGADWSRMRELPEPALKLAALESGDALIQTAGGLWRGNGSEAWRHASAVDELDWERLTSGTNSVRKQLACLETGRGTLSLTSTVTGCFGESTDSTVLELGAEGARLIRSGSRGTASSEPLSLAEARALVRRVQAALERPDDEPTCRSTTRWSTTLAWQCNGEQRHSLALETDECGPVSVSVTGGETRSRSGPPAYARVHALVDIVATPHDVPDAGR